MERIHGTDIIGHHELHGDRWKEIVKRTAQRQIAIISL
jgi:hypothetical protein